jgi:hypothetical protein
MTHASRLLLALAERIVTPYTRLPCVVAASVTGSVAKGIADGYSDLDLTMIHDPSLASEDELAAIRLAHGAADRKWVIGDRASGSFAEAYLMGGVEVQIAHSTVSAWEQTLVDVLEKLDCTSPAQKALEGTLVGVALHGHEEIDRWRARIAAYPPALGEAMVKRHLAFFPVWGLEHQFRTRDATIWRHEMLVQAAQNLMGILAGLNGLYYTSFQFKRMGRFIDSMAIVPPRLAERVEELFGAETERSGAVLEALVRDTLSLVDAHMPSVDTAPHRARLDWRQQPWLVE